MPMLSMKTKKPMKPMLEILVVQALPAGCRRDGSTRFGLCRRLG